jgi:hypothetical protein
MALPMPISTTIRIIAPHPMAAIFRQPDVLLPAGGGGGGGGKSMFCALGWDSLPAGTAGEDGGRSGNAFGGCANVASLRSPRNRHPPLASDEG